MAVWDLAVERDVEEEAAAMAADTALPPPDLPPQLLFVHQARPTYCLRKTPSIAVAAQFFTWRVLLFVSYAVCSSSRNKPNTT